MFQRFSPFPRTCSPFRRCERRCRLPQIYCYASFFPFVDPASFRWSFGRKSPSSFHPVSWILQSTPSLSTPLSIVERGVGFRRFDGFPRPLDFTALQRRCAFLLAIASSRRPSEVASLRCDSAYMTISMDGVRFLPSQLSKTVRQTHLGPSILVRRLPPSSPSLPSSSS